MRTLLISLTAASVLFSAGAQAQGGGSAEALSYTWTGPYFGINAGYGYQNSDWDFAPSGSTSTDNGSGVVGIQAGYDAQLGENLFVGLEASVDAANLAGRSRCQGTLTCETKLSSFGDLSARLGIAAGRSLWYAKGGIAYKDVTHHVKGTVDNRDNGRAEFGYLVGGGIEYALLYNLTTKLEYNYLGFNSDDSRLSPSGQTATYDESMHVVKLGLNFKFN